MPLSYTVLGEYTGSVKSGSYYLSTKDTGLFYISQSSDIWFGFSINDVIEIGVYSTKDQTLQSWGILDQFKEFKTVTLTYLDNLNVVRNYSYNELIRPFILYKNDSVLFKPYTDLNSVGITEGSYQISYNFSREMAGSPSSSLIIKEISPSRTEIKLIPHNKSDTQYDSFCIKKFPIRDVASVLLSIIKDLPYDKIYKTMSSLTEYQNGINFLKFMFFLPDDGSIIRFLKNMYEDYIKYTVLSSTQIQNGITPERISRIQGIKTYYSNFLLQNYENIADFNDIEQRFILFTNTRLDTQFSQFSSLQEQGYKDAKQFCYDFFVKYFYDNIVHPLQSSYEDKYFGYFKNVLNFGNNKYYQILTHDYLDERQSPTDPITLILKMSSALPSDIDVKDNCWVSNFGMVPYVFTAIVQNPIKYKTIKISPPNFRSPQNFINKEQSNTLYSSDDLANTSIVDDSININKKMVELNTDYSDYSKFIVFSSVENRLNIFKNKMVEWTILSASLVELERRYNVSLSSSISYPYYSKEKTEFSSQITSIIDSFDGYESYLFNNGNYQYNLSSNSFVSSSYVSEQDSIAQEYDINNRDNLITNTPQYITTDSNYNEYLTFLNMIGHHFDNIYTYIAAMPIERQVKNELISSIPTNTLKEMLYSFGWNVDDIIGSLDIDEVYINSMNLPSYNALSGEQRLQTIWNRILVNLPGIYKTKGTEECVNYLMACYGLPSSMITVREYGGTDYSNDNSPTYKLDEKTYMLKYSGVGDYIEGPIPSSTKTVELKFSIDYSSSSYYPNYKFFPLFTSIPQEYVDSGSLYFNWMLGFYKVPGQYSGRVIFQMGSGSTGLMITSSVLPIFNGDIFSIMLRKNNPDTLFESIANSDVIPLDYDLTVQRNENGRRIFYSTSSAILYYNDNITFSQFGKFFLTNGTFKGTLDKVSVWNVPINDADFEEHVNDLNSYGYSDSIPYQNLWIKLDWDYPQNMYSSVTNSVWITNASPYYSIPNYYTDETLTTIDPNLYSSSLDIINNRWSTYYPTGSIEIRAYNWPIAIGSAFSSSWKGYPTCSWISESIYPYHFDELTYQQDIDASKFGPNKYKNRKIRKISYEVNARFDPNNRSTNEPNLTISGESNQLGFFIDPQDSKNKDILRYIGNNGIIELIGDPANLYSDKYYDLVNKNYEYNYNGNKRTYFNELLTVYKFYFDKSIFQAINNVMPARTNIYTGVVIEPTILERPKYQNKSITASVATSYQASVNNIYTFEMDALWANFNTDWNLINSGSSTANIASQQAMKNSMPPNYQKIVDLNYLTNPTRNFPVNLGSGYYDDCMDKIQHNFYPDFELLARNWETITTPIYGSVSSQDQNGRLIVGPDHGVANVVTDYTGSNSNNHQIIYYMMKVWDKYYYYAKTGEYVHSSNVDYKKHDINYLYNGKYYYISGSTSNFYENPNGNDYGTASVYLYKYVIFDERYMRNLIYFTDLMNMSIYNSASLSYTYDYGTSTYLHRANTFYGTPDKKISNINSSVIPDFSVPNFMDWTSVNPVSFNINLNTSPQYFELVSGYPRNHYTHKMQQFSKSKYGTYNKEIFVKGKQTIDSTINIQGINDGTYPVQSFGTSNINVVNNSNIIQNIPSLDVGQLTTSGTST